MGSVECVFVALVIFVNILTVNGHGYLDLPCQRGTLWKCDKHKDNKKFEPDYNHMGLFCGGASVQWGKHGGKCGACGDEYGMKNPPHEAGGKYATGYIAETYQEGAKIPVRVNLTAHHKGYFNFSICPHNNIKTRVDPECFKKPENRLKVVESDSLSYKIPEHKIIKLHLQLPAGLTCDQCVLQWWYNTGNSWGVDPITKKPCPGCGRQETFVNCADVRILPSGSSKQTSPSPVVTTRTKATTHCKENTTPTPRWTTQKTKPDVTTKPILPWTTRKTSISTTATRRSWLTTRIQPKPTKPTTRTPSTATKGDRAFTCPGKRFSCKSINPHHSGWCVMICRHSEAACRHYQLSKYCNCWCI